MASPVVELKTDRALLQPNFDGYKLVLDPIPHWSQKIGTPVNRVYPDNEQYSLIHAKLFSLHNHLITDSWNPNILFYINSDWTVVKVTFNESQHKFEENEDVFKIPIVKMGAGSFNMNIQFISDKLAFISNGTGFIHIVHTGLRFKNYIWSLVYSNQALKNPFDLADVRKECIDGTNVINCLLQTIERTDKHFEAVINWLTLKQDRNSAWSVSSIKKLKGKGGLQYCALEPGSSAVYVASDHRFEFISDSDADIKPKPDVEEKKISYIWQQTSEDINIGLQLKPNCDRSSMIEFDVTPLKLKFKYGGEYLLVGDLLHPVDADLTTWHVDPSGKIDILLMKQENGLLWNEVFSNCNVQGEQIYDPSLVEDVHRRLSHLCSETEAAPDTPMPSFSNEELEECDSFAEEGFALERIHGPTHKVTHRVPLTVHQYMFTMKRAHDQAPAMCLRFDVDGCVWQPYKPTTDEWPVKHEGTLHAFGYIQSSKQERKFTACSPNFSYSVVSEATRHLLIYKTTNPEQHDYQLRRRTTTGESIRINKGQQYVYSIEQNGEVLGIHATDQFLFILTEQAVLVLQI